MQSRRASASLVGFLSNPQQGAGWIAHDAGRIQGYLLAVLMFSFEHGGMMAEIDEFYVRNGFEPREAYYLYEKPL